MYTPTLWPAVLMIGVAAVLPAIAQDKCAAVSAAGNETDKRLYTNNQYVNADERFTCISSIQNTFNELSSSLPWASAAHPEADVLPTATTFAAHTRAVYAQESNSVFPNNQPQEGVLRLAVLGMAATTPPPVAPHNPLQPAMDPPRWYIGPTGGALFSYASHAEEPHAFGSVAVANPESNNEMGWTTGLQVEYLLGYAKDARSSLIVGLGFASLPAELSQSVQTPLEFGNSASVLSDATYQKEISLSTLNLDVMYKYMIGRTRLAVMAGPSVGLVLHASQRERMALAPESPAAFVNSEAAAQQGIQFSNAMRTAGRESDIEEINAVQLWLQGGLRYEVSFRKWLLSPTIVYRYPLTSLRSDTGWKMANLMAGITVSHAIRLDIFRSYHYDSDEDSPLSW